MHPHDLLVFWLSVWVFFLMIEMFTGTLYGLSISLAGFVLAIYVFLTGEVHVGIVQATILVLISGVACWYFPKWFAPKNGGLKTGLDRSIGEVFTLKTAPDGFKIRVDWVDFLVDERCVTADFASGKKVTLNSHSSGTVEVTLV